MVLISIRNREDVRIQCRVLYSAAGSLRGGFCLPQPFPEGAHGYVPKPLIKRHSLRSAPGFLMIFPALREALLAAAFAIAPVYAAARYRHPTPPVEGAPP